MGFQGVRRIRQVTMWGGIGSVLACAPLTTAYGQERAVEPDTLGDIIVTAQRRAENLQDVPIAVSALSGDQLGDAGVYSVQDLKTAFAGVNMRSTSSYVQPSIRGISTSSINVENPVAIYVDGVYYSSQRDANRDLDDISQIAVLKGPQGTLFGRNATGGVIQIETRAPSKTLTGKLGATLENYGTVRLQASVSGPLADGVTASLAAASADQSEGWGRNVTTGRETYKLDHSRSVRGKIAFEPSDQTKFLVIGDYMSRADNFGAYFRPFPGTVAGVPGLIPVSSVYDASVDTDSRNYFKGGGGSLTASHNFGGVELTSITAYRRSASGYILDADMVPTLNFNVNVRIRADTFTQELRLASEVNDRFNWTVGAFYFQGKVAVAPEVDTLGNFFSAAFPLNVTQIITGSEKTRSIAPFGQIDFKLAENTRLTLGLRWTYEERKFEGTFTQPAVGQLPPINVALPQTKSDVNKPTWRVALDHHFSDDVMAYASLNRGFKSGGYNVANLLNPVYQPERLDAYEIGLKTELLDRRLRLNLAGFYYDYTNIQVVTFENFQNTIVNGAKAEVYGLDVDIEAQLARGLILRGGLEVLDANFISFPGALIAKPDPVFGAEVTLGDASGNRLPLSQKFNANLSLTYETDVSFGKLAFNATANHGGSYFFEADNRAKQAAYELINAGATWTSSDAGFSVQVFVRNLLDRKIIAQSSAIGHVGFLTTYDNPPRIYGISGRFQF